ncbi:hypothetical protein DMN91_005152 [Ooceraea biroi]|uniref:F-box/LRR-repeat protein n=1 Tax=Ooceraea biroi TaxID=2015173 RepID=A0A026WYR6_OOCBI|nr:F-box/LRR-repeat protein 4 [Ooceraea biroi]EZA61152.1 F-box/LRR-repeat protein [Ooceraea biroi]RLU22874.1 hypothetical protein DMN91_005152 [Ooceraea biroi]
MVHYSERLQMNNENYVTFVAQFVQKVDDFSSEYGDSNSISYTVNNITGIPSKFPDYGDFPHAYVMRTYGQWWDKAPSRSIDYMPQNNPDVVSHDYIVIRFHESVYPLRISIYEIYNPGSVVRIWAKNPDNQWFQLWSGPPQIVPPQARLFSPPLEPCNFKTNTIRLEFNHSQLDYYTEFDAVLLFGTFELVLPKSPRFKQSLSKLLESMNPDYPNEEDIYNLTPNHTNHNMLQLDVYRLKTSLQDHCAMFAREIVEICQKSKLVEESELIQFYHNVPPLDEGYDNMQRFLEGDLSEFVEKMNVPPAEPQELPINDAFSVLANETVLKILGYLDLKSLCRLRSVNRHFNNLAQDPLLYKRLNLKPYWHSFDEDVLHSLMPRFKYLQQLDLSWCGSYGMLIPDNLIRFFYQYGAPLTHLRLNCCEMVDDDVIYVISVTCKDLKELCLRFCQNVRYGFQHLQQLRCLEILDLYKTSIETADVCRILHSNPRMRHLNVAGVSERLDADEIARELGSSCLGLESVDFWKALNLSSQGINALTACRNLREVDFSWCSNTVINQTECFYNFFTCCKHLEKIFLGSFRGVTERDLRHLTLCKELKQLDLLGSMSITPEVCQDILLSCEKLELIDLSFCEHISNVEVDEWRAQFPNVAIKRSFPIQEARS